MSNPFKSLLALLPQSPRQVGDVVDIDDGVAAVELPGGGRVRALGAAAVGDRVFVRDGVIEGEAPDLPIVLIDV